jgi:beta-N-acetylhexosaminidase
MRLLSKSQFKAKGFSMCRMWNLVALALVSSLSCLAAITPKNMTIEEKVGQLLMPHFRGEVANDEARELIQEAYVGGIIYYPWANKLEQPEQVRALSIGLQALA